MLDKVILEISHEHKLSIMEAQQIVERVLYELSNNTTMRELMSLIKKYSEKYRNVE